MEYTVKDFYIPTVTYFESKNKLTGSRNGMNYKMVPQEKLTVFIWYGEMNLEHSETAAQKEFEISQESMPQIEAWLYEQYDLYLKTPQAAEYLKKKKKREV